MFSWLHSQAHSSNFTPYSVPIHSLMSSLWPFPTAHHQLLNQDNISQVLWESVLMATAYLPFLFSSSRACSVYIYCPGQWPSKAKPPLGIYQGQAWWQAVSISRLSVPNRKRAVFQRCTLPGAAKAADTEVAVILQQDFFSFTFVFLLEILWCKIQAWVQGGAGPDDICDRHLW